MNGCSATKMERAILCPEYINKAWRTRSTHLGCKQHLDLVNRRSITSATLSKLCRSSSNASIPIIANSNNKNVASKLQRCRSSQSGARDIRIFEVSKEIFPENEGCSSHLENSESKEVAFKLQLAQFLENLAGGIKLHIHTRKVLQLALLAASAAIFLSGFRPKVAHAATTAMASGDAVAHGAHRALSSGSVLMSAWTGLAAGWLHTLSGPDHLAALAPLSIGRTRLQSAAVGALWGCGHDVGQVLFGILFVLLKDKLHLEVLKVWSARVVGLTLIAIGAMGVLESREPPQEKSVSQEGAVALTNDKQVFNIATFATGIVHGLSPDALLVVLPALALPSKAAGAAFLVMFLLGTITAMGSYTAFIGSCSEALHKRVPWITQRLSLLASAVAIGVGLIVLVGELVGISIF